MAVSYSHVFEPIRIRGIDFKNRVFLAPTTPVLSTPDGNLLTSGTDFVMERLPFGVSFRSPLYTIPETEGYHNVTAEVVTYNAAGEVDDSLVGGTVQLSTGCAQEGSTVRMEDMEFDFVE